MITLRDRPLDGPYSSTIPGESRGLGSLVAFGAIRQIHRLWRHERREPVFALLCLLLGTAIVNSVNSYLIKLVVSVTKDSQTPIIMVFDLVRNTGRTIYSAPWWRDGTNPPILFSKQLSFFEGGDFNRNGFYGQDPFAQAFPTVYLSVTKPGTIDCRFPLIRYS